jgi:hypothetical protein
LTTRALEVSDQEPPDRLHVTLDFRRSVPHHFNTSGVVGQETTDTCARLEGLFLLEGGPIHELARQSKNGKRVTPAWRQRLPTQTPTVASLGLVHCHVGARFREALAAGSHHQ